MYRGNGTIDVAVVAGTIVGRAVLVGTEQTHTVFFKVSVIVPCIPSESLPLRIRILTIKASFCPDIPLGELYTPIQNFHRFMTITTLLDFDTAITSFSASQKKCAVETYHQLGEPFLLALDLLDRHSITHTQHDVYITGTTETRLSVWNCSCAQFIVSTFVEAPSFTIDNPRWGGARGERGYCKHLIACFLLRYGKAPFTGHCATRNDIQD